MMNLTHVYNILHLWCLCNWTRHVHVHFQVLKKESYPSNLFVVLSGLSSEEERITRTVHETQLPITAAYACTDYRAQGQTLPSAIIDISSPPTGALSLFNLYVALSRSKGRDDIRILRDFDSKWFRKGHDERLLLEDDRLQNLDMETTEWWRHMKEINNTVNTDV